ncbi:MAG: bifunctional 5,10-methylenetetrahydrofolate dehydrogenase/5,10-methenyltetrahydrofolate cyclohydrolase, partial [Candidatus Tectomicrobia bacterium]|nr:bifunctional 5,10-methylenetetrahydrofolate dehydrogenase/5,10-methenyltetrahydrofolate cyclohydrolase [Candidatus Tectomicrobia bacterium]
MIIPGREISHEIRKEVKAEIRALKRKTPFGPGLSVILVGDNPASEVYVRNKVIACSNVGIASFSHTLPEDTKEEKLISLIESLNQNERVHGILVQWPLPKQIRWRRVIEVISPEKDVDGFHPLNVAKLFTDTLSLAPCTPLGIMELLDRVNIDVQRKNAVIIGASN